MKRHTLTLLILFTFFGMVSNAQSQISEDDLQELVGDWKLDMSPQDATDDNFAMMRITSITSDTLEGEFYRSSVAIREGRVNTQRGIIYVALISGDNSGEYNSTFYYENGMLYGTTHAVDRGFLAVWTATKNN